MGTSAFRSLRGTRRYKVQGGTKLEKRRYNRILHSASSVKHIFEYLLGK